MDLYQLRALREVAEQGSIAGAARALGVTSSATSQVIASLQRQFSAPLTQRRGRKVELTDVGRALLVEAAAVSEAVSRAENVVGRYFDDPVAKVRVSAFHSAAVEFFPSLVAWGNGEDRPLVECVDEDVAIEEFPALTANYDIVIAHRMGHRRSWESPLLTVIPLLQEPIDVAIRADHPLAKHASLTPTDVMGHNWVATHDGYSPAALLDAVSAVSGTPPRIRHRINDFVTAAAMVAEGNYLALLPRHTAAPAADSGVVLRPLSGLRTTRHIDLLLRPEQQHRTAVALVAHHLQGLAAKLVTGKTS
ncbi:LysR family transcriptional regulator [Leucobacter komagatae]|uniref:HTH lysR-type domain-containing protein n=1 Tax=Leucobacter komagatae TaxID=55969 RepID=A0A0D0IJ21_9MICO|nr:LysR family transcriptional regulator [Leucobacter komagatae]KIP51664.1 hypothetical protein SD72_14030 [Leucobacter komagatae]